ncbi:hypothetical protein [Micromonospora sp. WMMD980]|uniref:hypothetical protein n=1 Tax=Micromonospora sp. WMMD980 TaxID=3016088 RepID=UPI00241761A0|nr:hypothetical protein [Micromonospora sp. WMMD980]MDG4803396.1 hypothetical protein [Micromonospora sp. WMMD980]
MSINSSGFEACRRLFTYRAGIWVYRLAIVLAVFPWPFRAVDVRLMSPPGAATMAAVGFILMLVGHRLVLRSHQRAGYFGDGYDPLRPPGGLVARDVFRLTYW